MELTLLAAYMRPFLSSRMLSSSLLATGTPHLPPLFQSVSQSTRLLPPPLPHHPA